jgi:hypothetical protein
MVTSLGRTQDGLLEDQEITRPINKLMAGEKGWMRKMRLKGTGVATRGWRDSKNEHILCSCSFFPSWRSSI